MLEYQINRIKKLDPGYKQTLDNFGSSPRFLKRWKAEIKSSDNPDPNLIKAIAILITLTTNIGCPKMKEVRLQIERFGYLDSSRLSFRKKSRRTAYKR